MYYNSIFDNSFDQTNQMNLKHFGQTLTMSQQLSPIDMNGQYNYKQNNNQNSKYNVNSNMNEKDDEISFNNLKHFDNIMEHSVDLEEDQEQDK